MIDELHDMLGLENIEAGCRKVAIQCVKLLKTRNKMVCCEDRRIKLGRVVTWRQATSRIAFKLDFLKNCDEYT